ncbi:MAG: bifunctional phosphoribosylaminoimidazolecarboxamide formyltransferase/IMP cyclohydrolase, partial [Thermoleophilia bacterium]|nr:bifunctional phosphoribosylaminoimidazolecarboxamide formyltransferase/IMP cyclohydrolase [Thermoleophilia bacterium]
MRALISVSEKTALDAFARGLDELGAELVASGGTAAYLQELGLDVRRVEELTEVPELLGGRVKTLHPRVHAGILARRDRDDDLAALAEHEIPPFDLVCVNLYPFERDPGVELIDVGGPAMLRAAAKNWAHVAAVSSPDQYAPVLAELRERGELSDETRRALAGEAFATTAAYDAAIARWLAREGELPQRLVVGLRKELELAYGENPHQRAAYYVEDTRHLLAGVRQLQGRSLSFNNLNDLAGALRLLAELEPPACVIVKHANPCGAAGGATAAEAYERALACDPVSAFGGVVALSEAVHEELAERLATQFIEVLVAPAVPESAVERLAIRPALRVLVGKPPRP